MIASAPDVLGQWNLAIAVIGLLFLLFTAVTAGLVGIAWKAAALLGKINTTLEGHSKGIKDTSESVRKLTLSVDEAVREIRHIDGRLVEHERRDSRIEESLRDHERRVGILEANNTNARPQNAEAST